MNYSSSPDLRFLCLEVVFSLTSAVTTSLQYTVSNQLFDKEKNEKKRELKRMTCEQKNEQFKLRFLDCDCTCCGIRQRSIPSLNCETNQSSFQQILNDISKPRYGLDCNCLCGNQSSTMTIDPCTCPTALNTSTTPIQVNFGVDTGIKQMSDQ